MWSSDRFWNLSACKVYKKISGRIFAMFASENEAVCCEVQLHFRSSLCKVYSFFARFTEEVMGAFSRFMCPKIKLFHAKFRRISEVFTCKVYKEISGCIITIFVFKNEAVCREVQMHFGSSPHSRFPKRFLGAFSQFMRPKTKLFSVKFGGILEVFSMQALWKSSWRNFTINVSRCYTNLF